MSAERRRLRFSFQINDVKDLTGVSGPHRFAPGGGEERRIYSPRSGLSTGVLELVLGRSRFKF